MDGRIRNSVKAIIIENNCILTIKAADPWGDYYLLPGGGQRAGETMHQALERECLEEIGTTVEIHDLKLVREYIGANHEFSEHDGDVHQIELMFLCSLPEGVTPTIGSDPDSGQSSVEWLDLDRLDDYRLYPRSLRGVLSSLSENVRIYYGDIN